MTHGAVRALGPFVRLHGCDAGDEACFGPVGEYWTLYGTPLPLLGLHAVVACVLALALGVILWRRGRSRGWRRAGLASAASALVVAPLLFLALAAAFPVEINY